MCMPQSNLEKDMFQDLFDFSLTEHRSEKESARTWYFCLQSWPKCNYDPHLGQHQGERLWCPFFCCTNENQCSLSNHYQFREMAQRWPHRVCWVSALFCLLSITRGVWTHTFMQVPTFREEILGTISTVFHVPLAVDIADPETGVRWEVFLYVCVNSFCLFVNCLIPHFKASCVDTSPTTNAKPCVTASSRSGGG
jgi:hypothetical protein